ncbi:endonuclease [Epilithonimonas hominis]|uniref:T9SS C-terminal target domain-containing protein n=3 Tax=Epilithonimonas hominis TaxID=420404 RepID=A0A3N0XB88_9FLAO|nr:endonuclease [Epilithonimonas hominis]ROI14634.1 T9SS C-terminal target domain-containing protein [Epilithonimonas hominis]
MKKSLLLLLAGISGLLSAQIPTGYYDSANGLTGSALKTQLRQIITNGHQDMGYGSGSTGLWKAFQTTDRDKYYENDNTILDMYSENPAANTPGVSNDPYQFNFGQVSAGGNQCGSTNQNNEGFCYNREHSLPKSFFGGQNATPMANDANFVIPTDYYVNSKRGNYNYGEVGTASQTFLNGTKIGSSKTPGFFGTVFEPINEFKGDMARMHLYFITRYENNLSDFYNLNVSGSPFDGNKFPGFQSWYINMLLRWSAQDPVSQKEIDRNNAVYVYQKNRNPFIDHPEWITAIWGSALSIDDASFSKNLTIAPNPVKGNIINITGDQDLKQFKKVFIYNTVGQNVQTIENPFQNGNTITLKNLPKGVYILKTGELNTKFIVD